MASPETYRARELRYDMSNTERRVWYRLRRRQVGGFKFRRQLSIGPYFADFTCLQARLVIEVDGEGHEEETDQRKTAYLESQGFRVMRIPARNVDDSLDAIIDEIANKLSLRPPPP